MAITKTNFINYIRCPRYVALEEIKKEKLEALVTLEEYRKEELDELMVDLVNEMYDEETGEDLIDVENKQLEIMMPYYKEIELLAGKYVEKYFDGKAKYSKETNEQESFDFLINGIRYLCYVDIYNETKEGFSIIEVKATTSKKFLSMGKNTIDSFGKKICNSIFEKCEDNIYRLREEVGFTFNEDLSEKDYLKHKANLFNKYNGAGRYVYDIAVQRYIIENDLKTNNIEIKDNKYYLAVLNHEYVFDGTYENNKAVYNKDINGNELIVLFDVTKITKEYLDLIDLDRKRIEQYILEKNIEEVKLGNFCELKKPTKCKFTKVCYSLLPQKNSILSYLGSHHGFKDEVGNKYDRYDLIKEGKVSILDVPVNYLNRPNNIIQRDCVENHTVFKQIDKIKSGIDCINYPIYHLDFETFPCPLPRYNGEVPYTQSVFQFSLHVELTPLNCDKDKNHYEFLAKDHTDNREELIKKMIEYIDTDSGGTILVYNESFEKTRLKELGNIFPLYKSKLDKMNNMIFDLMYLVNTNTSLYESLGYETEKAKLFNYYNSDLNGSFSIKKVLPIFTNLSYKDLEVGNGMEALITYASFPKLTKEEYNHKYNALIKYCKQDTWAMVEILWGLKEFVK